MRLDEIASFFKTLQSSKLDDTFDRLHYISTTTILSFFALLIGSKQTFGEPIRCVVPAEFPGEWGNYIHDYCYSTGTFHTGNGTDLDNYQSRVNVGYYQWVPYFLIFQALAFYAPHFFWLRLQSMSDLDYKDVVHRCADASSLVGAKRTEVVEELALYIKEVCQIKSTKAEICGLGRWATIVYIISKMLNLVNVFLQLYLLNVFIGNDSMSWALKVLHEGWKGHYWDATGYFPRITYCEFDMKRIQVDQESRIVQCVLMINMINEKTFIILYFWFVALLAMTTWNLVHTCSLFMVYSHRARQIQRFLLMRMSGNRKFNQAHIDCFINNIMNYDGLLLLRLVDIHAGKLIASELIGAFFSVHMVEEYNLQTIESKS